MEFDRNAKEGPLTHCQVCGSGNLELVIDLGHQPLCDSLLSEENLKRTEVTYPLRQMRCVDCTNNQLDYVVASKTVYHAEYPYKSGVTKELVTYQRAMAKSIVEALSLPRGAFVVDFGSNDGTLLAGFQALGMSVLGVEPTNIAKLAIEAGIPTRKAFFNSATAEEIVDAHGRASLITATNVFAHMADLGSVMEGIRTVLADDGVFVTESHYLLDILEKVQYDSIYHEHIRSYSLRALVTLCEAYGLHIFRAVRGDRYAGNIRIFAAQAGRRSDDGTVAQLLKLEHESGISDPRTYQQFRDAVETSRYQLMEFLVSGRQRGRDIVGKACPGRCSTLLNYCGVDRGYLRYLSEQEASLKVGLHLPGKHIPIVADSQLLADNPDDIIIMAWHYKDAIVQYLRDLGVTSRIHVPLPEFERVA
jgi:hypothetical protein